MNKKEEQRIIEEVRRAYNKIEVRRKKNKIELGGWILHDHILWLDKSFCRNDSVFVDDDVSISMSLIKAISFHTHSSLDTWGENGISAHDQAMATAFGHEVVFTCDGAYLIIPCRKKRVKAVRRTQSAIEVKSIFLYPDSKEEQDRYVQEQGIKIFKCHNIKI